jgi:transcription termination/antitermination protein NusG
VQRKWYAIYAFPGYEHRVRAALLRKIREKKMESYFGEVIVPTEKVVEFAHGQKRIVEHRMFPGYLLAQLDLTDEVWHLIRSIPKVRGLVGKGQSATALRTSKYEESWTGWKLRQLNHAGRPVSQ